MGRRAFIGILAAGFGTALVRTDVSTAAVGEHPEQSQIAAAAAAVDQAERALSRAARDEERAIAAADDAARESRAATDRAAAATREEAAATRELAAAEADAEHAVNVLGELAREAYRNNTGITNLAAVMAATSPTEFATRLDEFNQVTAAQADIVAAAEAATAKAAATRAHRAERRRVAEEEARAAAHHAADAADHRMAARRARQDADAALADRRKALAALRDQLSRTPAATAPATGRRRLRRPVPGPVTSPFGMRVHPITGVRKLHTGTDFRAPCRADIAAAAAGRVTDAGYRGAYGNRVVLDHGTVADAHVATTYSHLDSMAVSVGDQVDAGQLVGRSGTTGLSTACHLHFEVLVDGEFTDPMAWITR